MADINSCSARALAKIADIPINVADDVVKFRRRTANIRNYKQLMKVPGMTKVILHRIRSNCKISMKTLQSRNTRSKQTQVRGKNESRKKRSPSAGGKRTSFPNATSMQPRQKRPNEDEKSTQVSPINDNNQQTDMFTSVPILAIRHQSSPGTSSNFPLRLYSPARVHVSPSGQMVHTVYHPLSASAAAYAVDDNVTRTLPPSKNDVNSSKPRSHIDSSKMSASKERSIISWLNKIPSRFGPYTVVGGETPTRRHRSVSKNTSSKSRLSHTRRHGSNSKNTSPTTKLSQSHRRRSVSISTPSKNQSSYKGRYRSDSKNTSPQSHFSHPGYEQTLQNKALITNESANWVQRQDAGPYKQIGVCSRDTRKKSPRFISDDPKQSPKKRADSPHIDTVSATRSGTRGSSVVRETFEERVVDDVASLNSPLGDKQVVASRRSLWRTSEQSGPKPGVGLEFHSREGSNEAGCSMDIGTNLGPSPQARAEDHDRHAHIYASRDREHRHGRKHDRQRRHHRSRRHQSRDGQLTYNTLFLGGPLNHPN